MVRYAAQIIKPQYYKKAQVRMAQLSRLQSIQFVCIARCLLILLLVVCSGCVTGGKRLAASDKDNIQRLAVVVHVDKTAFITESHFRVLANVTNIAHVPVVGWDFGRAYRDMAHDILRENHLFFELVDDDSIADMTFPVSRDDRGIVTRRDYAGLLDLGIDTVLEFAAPGHPPYGSDTSSGNIEAVIKYGYYKYTTTGYVPIVGAEMRLIDIKNNEVMALFNRPTAFYSISIAADSFSELEKDGLRLFKEGLMRRAEQQIRKGTVYVGLITDSN